MKVKSVAGVKVLRRVLARLVALALAISGCKGDTKATSGVPEASGGVIVRAAESSRPTGVAPGAAGEATGKIAALYSRRAEILDGWLKIVDANAASPQDGIREGNEFVERFKAEMTKLGRDLYELSKDTSQRDIAQYTRATAESLKRETDWRKRQGEVITKYGARAGDLNGQYATLNDGYLKALMGK